MNRKLSAVIGPVLFTVLCCTLPTLADFAYTITDLGPIGGTSYGVAINDAGQVVGQAAFGGAMRAFRYDDTTIPKMQDLGTLGGSLSGAHGINDSGRVVGYSQVYGGNYHAFRTTANTPSIALPTI